jgi:hypothetical protein
LLLRNPRKWDVAKQFGARECVIALQTGGNSAEKLNFWPMVFRRLDPAQNLAAEPLQNSSPSSFRVHFGLQSFPVYLMGCNAFTLPGA